MINNNTLSFNQIQCLKMRIGEHTLAKKLNNLADKIIGLMELNYKECKKQVNLDRSLDQFHSYLSEIFKILDKWN